MIDMLSKIENRGIAHGRELGLAQGCELGLAQGREQGFTLGREQGWTQGCEHGLAKGREQERADIAQNMLADGMAPELVAKYTGFSRDRGGTMASEVLGNSMDP